MGIILEVISNLIDYSFPTIFVIVGLALLVLPFFKNMEPGERKSARKFGIVIGAVGLGLGLFIKPQAAQQQPVYIIPAQVSAPLPSESTQLPTLQTIATEIIITEQLITPETENSPTSPPLTPEPVITVIPVRAFEENGVRVNISTPGIYKVSYLGDAYSPWPNEYSEGYQGWTTIIRIYVNRAIEWGLTDYGLVGPINQDDYLSPGGYYLNKDQAITVSTGDSRTFRLNQNDYLILVALDERGRYRDNQGKVDVGITYIGQ